MAYSPQQQQAFDAAAQVYLDRIANFPVTMDKIEALSLSRNYGGEHQTTHGENTRLWRWMKILYNNMRDDLNVCYELNVITQDQYYEQLNAIGDRLLAFEAANPIGFKII